MAIISSKPEESFSRVRTAVAAGLVLTALLSVSTRAHAEPPLPDAASPVVPAPPKPVGGHVGIATPLVTVSKKTTTIADQLTVLNPIGIGFKVSDHVAIDFETVVATPVHQPGSVTGLVVDPGVIYGFGRAALGLRLAFKTNAPANVGLIPLFNYGLVDLGCATWFAEAAFPTFYAAEAAEFNVVIHTGVGF
jgi:hypothetical protein